MKYLVIIIFCFSFLTSCKKDPVNTPSPTTTTTTTTSTIYKVKYVVKSLKSNIHYYNEYGGVSERINISNWDTTLNIESKKLSYLTVFGTGDILAEIYVNDKIQGKATSLGATEKQPGTATASYFLP